MVLLGRELESRNIEYNRKYTLLMSLKVIIL